MLKRIKTPSKQMRSPCGFECCSKTPLQQGKYYIVTAGALAKYPYLVFYNTIVPLSALLLLERDSFYYSRIINHVKFIFHDLSVVESVIDFYKLHVKNSTFELIDAPFTFHTGYINYANLTKIGKYNLLKNAMFNDTMSDDQIIKSSLVKTVATFYEKKDDQIILKVNDDRFTFAKLVDEYTTPNTKLEVVLFNEGDEYPLAKLIRVIGNSCDLSTELNCIMVKNGIKVIPYDLYTYSKEFDLRVRNLIYKLVIDRIINKEFITEVNIINETNSNCVYGISDQMIGALKKHSAHNLSLIEKINISLSELTNEKLTNELPSEYTLFLANDKELNELITQNYLEEFNFELENNLRMDFTDKRIFNIDPPGCTDIDDAFHVECTKDLINVFVHISDVSALIKEGSYLDKLALERGNTFYLNYFRIEMINLTDLLSLNEGVKRLSFTVKLTFKNDELINEEFYKCKIKNSKSFEYEAADKLIHSKCNDRCIYKDTLSCHTITNSEKNNKLSKEMIPYFEDIKVLNELSIKLRNKRMLRGSLNLNLNKSLDANHLVEEFMLLANQSVAEKISENISILRRHEGLNATMDQIHSIVKENKESFIKFTELKGSSNFSTHDHSATITYDNKKEESVFVDPMMQSDDKIFKKLIIRNMKQAEYFCSSDFISFHYGLAAEKYTHFTSPIRRYADIIVHRILLNTLEGINTSDLHNIRKICQKINISHRNSRNASRAIDILLFYLSLGNKEYTISSINENEVLIHENNLEVKIENTGFYENKKIIFKKNDALFYDCQRFTFE